MLGSLKESEMLTRQKIKGAGNQQGKTHFNIGWLVGLFEGEGCVTLSRSAMSKNKHGHKITPYMSITGMNENLMGVAIETIEEFRLPLYVTRRQGVIRIHVAGLGRCKRWIEFLLPYLVGKKEPAEIVLQFIKSRENVLNEHPWSKPYTDHELELFSEVHALNRGNAKPSTTTRRPWQKPLKV